MLCCLLCQRFATRCLSCTTSIPKLEHFCWIASSDVTDLALKTYLVCFWAHMWPPCCCLSLISDIQTSKIEHRCQQVLNLFGLIMWSLLNLFCLRCQHSSYFCVLSHGKPWRAQTPMASGVILEHKTLDTPLLKRHFRGLKSIKTSWWKRSWQYMTKPLTITECTLNIFTQNAHCTFSLLLILLYFSSTTIFVITKNCSMVVCV